MSAIEFSDGTSLDLGTIEQHISFGSYDGGPGNDVLIGDTIKDRLYGNGGNDLLRGGVGDDSLTTLDGNDRLYGDEGNDSLTAGGGDDELWGGDGDDTLGGGAGNDRLAGGSGFDTYSLYVGSGKDIIDDVPEAGSGWWVNRIQFVDAIRVQDLSVALNGTDLVISYGDQGDTVTIRNYDVSVPAAERVLDRIDFIANPTQPASLAALLEKGNGPGGSENSPPEIDQRLEDESVRAGQQWQFMVPENAFLDPEGEVLTFNAVLADGSPLPAWLMFDPVSRAFSGVPSAQDAGVLALRVTATDPAGAFATQNFALAVTPAEINAAPAVGVLLVAQQVAQDAALHFVVPEDAFSDADGDALVFAALLTNGSALPPWLRFDATTRTFSGTPSNADVGSLSLRITATDQAGASATQSLALAVANIKDAPLAGTPLAELSTDRGTPFVFTMPADAFSDPDGDVLVFSATRADGSALPQWLSFDAAAVTFRGTPAQAYAGSLALRVTATDASGAWATQDFVLQIAHVNDSPVAGAGLPAQSAQEGRVFSYAIAPQAFSDPDGDALSLSVIRQDGSPLPTWLGFDAATGTLSGKPGQFDVGNLALRVTAHDGQGASASQTLQLSVAAPPNSTPTVSGTTGSNWLFGGSGHDLLGGGQGNDWLMGGGGDDVYLYRSGDGKDRIVELLFGGTDTLRLLDLNPNQIRVVSNGWASAQVIDTTTSQVIDLNLGLGSFRLPQDGVERIEFADGTLWERSQIVAAAEGGGGFWF